MKRGRKPADAAQILEAACRVFSKKGYFQSTVDEVMDAAGVGKGTVYRHFSDKESLLLGLLTRTSDDLNKVLSTGIHSEKSVEGRLNAIARNTLEYFSSRPAVLRIFMREGTLSIPAVRKSMGMIVEQSHDRVATLLGGPAMRRAAAVFNGMIFSLLRQKLVIADQPIHPSKDAAYLVAIFLYGIRGRPR